LSRFVGREVELAKQRCRAHTGASAPPPRASACTARRIPEDESQRRAAFEEARRLSDAIDASGHVQRIAGELGAEGMTPWPRL
jgi:hypothetical protein